MKKYYSAAHSLIATTVDTPPSPKLTKSLSVVTITKNRKEENKDKAKIGVGTYITVKVGEIVENIREGKIRRTRKELSVWM